MPMPDAGEVQGLEKLTNTSYGKATAQRGDMDKMLETSPESNAGRQSSSSGRLRQRTTGRRPRIQILQL